MWGLAPFDQLWCRFKFRQARYDWSFTPVGLEPTLVYLACLERSEWAGAAVDPAHKLLALNVNHFTMYNKVVRG